MTHGHDVHAPPHERPHAHSHPHADDLGGSAPLSVAVLVVSDTRTLDTDTSGRALKHVLTAAGFEVPELRIVPDDVRLISEAARELLSHADLAALVVTGGTGPSPRDVTPEAVEPLLTKTLPGFGVQFQILSREQIGSAAYLSRAFAGLAGEKVVFVLPGSEKAVRLAAEALIIPELPHLTRLVRGGRQRAHHA